MRLQVEAKGVAKISHMAFHRDIMLFDAQFGDVIGVSYFHSLLLSAFHIQSQIVEKARLSQSVDMQAPTEDALYYAAVELTDEARIKRNFNTFEELI